MSPSTIALAVVVVCLALACCIVVVARRLARPPLEQRVCPHAFRLTQCGVSRSDDGLRLWCATDQGLVLMDVSDDIAAAFGRQVTSMATPGAPRPLNRSSAERTH